MTYGISDLSIIPMRANPDDKSEMINQILFGETYKIIKKEDKFSFIELTHDKYSGWICNKQVFTIDELKYNDVISNDNNYLVDLFSNIESDIRQTIVMGSLLHNVNSLNFDLNNKRYNFKGKYSNGFNSKDKIIEHAMMYLGSPYLWGGRTPFGIDCSGFTQIVYRLNNINLPRDAKDQCLVGHVIDSINDSEAGDLAFFGRPKGFKTDGVITHVGIILDNNQIIHASGKVRVDMLDEEGIFNKKKNIYTHNLKFIQQIF